MIASWLAAARNQPPQRQQRQRQLLRRVLITSAQQAMCTFLQDRAHQGVAVIKNAALLKQLVPNFPAARDWSKTRMLQRVVMPQPATKTSAALKKASAQPLIVTLLVKSTPRWQGVGKRIVQKVIVVQLLENVTLSSALEVRFQIRPHQSIVAR